ncbi:MAG TPA: carboxypeptidase-like regulatory domain-containing protein [Planctomycetota bacterium]|nr:carboxypeptidase-like regulatory domain-containing protein [Planctomycetota bacterium]
MKRILPALALLLILALVAWWVQARARSVPLNEVTATEPIVPLVQPQLDAPVELASDTPRETVAEASAPSAPAESAPVLSASPDHVFHARAVDLVTRVAVAGAKVKWDGVELLTNLDGRFSFHGEDWTNESMQLDAAGYSRVWILPSSGHETAETALEISMTKCATLRVHVLEASGRPIVGANVTAVVARYKLLQPEEQGVQHRAVYEDDFFRAKTDGTGTAVLASLPARAGMKLSAERLRESLRSENEELVLQPGEEREWTWHIGTGCRVFGTVTAADGRRTEGQEIWLQPARMNLPRFFERFDDEGRRETRCDARGEYEFTDVTPGSWCVGPADARGQGMPWKEGLVAPWAEHIDVSAELQEVRVDIVLTHDLAIRGRVEDSHGNPVATTVLAARETSSVLSITQSDADGRFVIGPLVPGNYRLHANARHRGNDRGEMGSDEWTAVAGSNDIVLRLQLGCTVSGTVVDEISGETLQATLTLTPDSPGQEKFRSMTQLGSSNASGQFSISGLPPGVYSLSASTLSGRIGILRSFALAQGADRVGVELRVARGGTVNVFYDGSAPYAGVRLSSLDSAFTSVGIQKGTRRSFTVPVGRTVARLMLFGDATQFETAFDLAVGETKELTFDGAWK